MALKKLSAPAVATSRTMTSLAKGGMYRPNWIFARAGADDHEKHPSRIGNRLVYRDGREERVPCA